MSAPVPTLRIDTSGTAFGTAPTYTDRTSYLMTGSQYPVDITFGRQDEQSEPQPSTCSFFLSNANGYWTPGAGVGPAGWDIGCPVNVRLTANAVTYDRFTGFVDAIEPTWPGGVQSWSVVKVSCTDVAARLGIAKPLRALVLHEMLADSPTYLYPLGEAQGSTSGASIVGTATPAYQSAVNGGTGATFGFDGFPSLLEPATGVDFGLNVDAPAVGAATAYTRLVLQPLVPAASGFTVEMLAVMPSAVPAVAQYLFYEARADGGYVTVYISSTGQLLFKLWDGFNDLIATVATSVCDGRARHIAGVLDSDRKVARLYVDGVQIASDSNAVALSFPAAVSAELSGFGYPFTGAIAHHALYPSALSASRVLAHYQAGVGTGPAERSDQRFSRVAAYGGITTSGLPTGVATVAGQRLADVTAVEALKKVARTEGTFAYVTTAGALTFQSRNHRYHRAVELALASSDIATPGVRRDRQGVANEITVTREGGASQTVIDSASQTSIGRFDGGSFEVCPSTDEDAWQNATWQVQNRKTTRTRLPDLTVDLYRQTSTAVVASCLSATIGTKAQVTSLPANAPAATMTLFVEGYTETIGYDRWSMGFYTSPIGLEDSVLVLDNATTGVLDTYRLGF